MTEADCYVNAGQALLNLGRWLQRTYPVPTTIGSQYSEDAILAELLPEPNGIYVDVGAYHGIECSNTHKLYEKGWRGLLIEPLPDCWPSLLIDRTDDFLCPFAASNEDGFATLRLNRSVSSLREDWPNDATESIPVRTAKLSTILKMYPQMDWSDTKLLSIDVEGAEREVLEGIDWIAFRPTVIVIEFRTYDAEKLGEDVSDKWKHILEGQGYKLNSETPLNKIYTL